MDIRTKLEEVFPAIQQAEYEALSIDDYVGTGLQIELEKRMNAVLPPEIGYRYEFMFNGANAHVFFEKANRDNEIRL
jgi:hypothetical protein